MKLKSEPFLSPLLKKAEDKKGGSGYDDAMASPKTVTIERIFLDRTAKTSPLTRRILKDLPRVPVTIVAPAAAAVDVWAKEPTDNPVLAAHPKIIAMPHVGASTVEGPYRVGLEVADRVIECLK